MLGFKNDKVKFLFKNYTYVILISLDLFKREDVMWLVGNVNEVDWIYDNIEEWDKE